MKSATTLLLSAALLSACSSRPGPSPATEALARLKTMSSDSESSSSEIKPVVYKSRLSGEIAPGFELELSTPDDPNITGRFRVEFDGKLKLPYQVEVNAAGETLEGLRRKIAAAYSRYFVTPPLINLSVTDESYLVAVRGLVNKPGKYLVKETATLDDLIALGEGLIDKESRAEEAHYVRISQLGVSSVIKLSDYYSGSDQLIPRWQGGDSVFFQSEAGSLPNSKGFEQKTIQMIGQVSSPGEYFFRKDGDFFYYLAKAGGPTEAADLDKVEIVRAENSEIKSISFSADNTRKLPSIMAGDIVMVHAEKDSPILSDVSNVLSSVASVFLIMLGL